MRGGQKQASKSSLSMRMTSSLKDQTSFDKNSLQMANALNPRQKDNLPNFENKRNTPYFNQISFDKNSQNMGKFEEEKKQKDLLMDLISAERHRKLGNSLGSLAIMGNSKPGHGMKPKFVEIAAPKNTMIDPKRSHLDQSAQNYETKLYESNNTYNFHLSSSQNKADTAQPTESQFTQDKPKRETDLMEIDFELDPEHFNEPSEEEPAKPLSVKSESESMEIDTTEHEETPETFDVKPEEATRQEPAEVVPSMPSQKQERAPKFRMPAKSDGNATVGQQSFVTSSRLTSGGPEGVELRVPEHERFAVQVRVRGEALQQEPEAGGAQDQHQVLFTKKTGKREDAANPEPGEPVRGEPRVPGGLLREKAKLAQKHFIERVLGADQEVQCQRQTRVEQGQPK